MNMKNRIKKIGALLLAGVLLAGNITSAETVPQIPTEEKEVHRVYHDNGEYKYEVLPDGKSLRLWTCTKAIREKARKVVLPKEIDGLPVKELGRECMGSYYRDRPENLSVKEVVIPSGIEYIGEDAFFKCPNLEKVSIGDSVSKIDDSAFYLCTNLKSVDGGKNVKYVGVEAFACCKKLANIPKFWNKSNKEIEHGYACFRKTGVRSVTIPRWDTEVNDMFYAECINLRKVVLTKGQKLIDSEAFYMCKNLKNVKFCPGLTTIGDSFRYCEKLERADIPKTVKLIGRRAFQHCRSLKTVSLPNSLECLYDMAFQDCRSLKQIKIPKKIKKIEQKTFQGCKKLKKAVIPKSVKKIHKTAFSGCKKLVIHCQKGSYAHKYAKKYHIKHQFIK